MITLTIKKKWFGMIKSGEKKEEYRQIKPYYDSRFKDIGPEYMYKIIFRNGYSKNSPAIKCNCIIYKRCGNSDWGAIPDKEYYVLKILSAEEVKNE